MRSLLLSFLLLLVAALTWFNHVQAQAAFTSPTKDTLNTRCAPEDDHVKWYTMISNIPRDWERWYDVSFRKERLNEWLWIGGLTLATYATDDMTYTPAENFYHSSSSAKKVSDFCANIGDGTTQFVVAGALGAYGLVFGDQKALRTGSQIVEVVLASGAVVQVLKHVTGRESPFVRTTPFGVWKILPNQIDYHQRVPQFDAYPSGHICTSIATVIVLAENYPDVSWIRPVGYAFTTLVGLGMLSNGIHWVSDYPLGLFIGYYFGMLAAHPEGLPVTGSGDGKYTMHIQPSLTPFGTGVSFIMNF
jgi:hypothetical protein